MYAYSLGSLEHITNPVSMLDNHIECVLCDGTHAMIFPKKARNKYITNIDKYVLSDHDKIMSWNILRYTYHETLVAQTYPDTENKRGWGGVI